MILGAADASGARSQPDVVRRWVPVVALAVAVLAEVTDPADWIELVVLGVAVAVFGLWSRVSHLPTLGLTVAVLTPVAFAQRSGQLAGDFWWRCSRSSWRVGRTRCGG